MKQWIKYGALGLAALLSTSLIVVSGYLFGWKTGSAALAPLDFRVSSEPSAANSAPSTAPARSAPAAPPANYESESMEDVLRAAWTSYRFASDRDVAAARLWELLKSLDDAELSTAFSLACELPGTDTKRNAIWMVLLPPRKA